MLVQRKNLSQVVHELAQHSEFGLDTETTGLRLYHGDRMFSLILSTVDKSYYFNFQTYKDLDQDWILDKKETLALLTPAVFSREVIYFIQNATFDMGMLRREGVELIGRIYDTKINGRLLYNRWLKYDLDALAKDIGLSKSDAVWEHILKNKLYSWTQSPGKAKKAKQPHFDKVPYNIIAPYGETDGEVVLKVGKSQLERLSDWNNIIPGGGLANVIKNESDLVKVIFDMEQRGLKINLGYCKEALSYEQNRALEAAKKFAEITGEEFKDSNKPLARAFDKAGENYPRTAKGNPSFTDDVLESFTSPLAKILQEYRDATKRANTYFANFLYYSDSESRIHANADSAGTVTGRFSYSDPNCQNWHKDDPGSYPVRRAVIPDSEDYYLVAIDYQAAEFRLLLDYAKELKVIRRIMDDGLDVHQATADQMGVTRTKAKTLNFGIIYGMGNDKLATALGITANEAKDLKAKYFSDLPGIAEFSRGVTTRADTRGFIFNWAGRVYHYPYLPDPRKPGRMSRYAYKALNHLIQGGVAEIIKVAMLRLAARLAGTRSYMMLQLHDEVLFSVHKNELELVPELAKIMEGSYQHKHLPMAASIEYSRVSWKDKEPWPT